MDSLTKKVLIGALLFFLIFTGTSCRFGKQKSYEGTYDIPALIGKNIDEVREVLGKPLDNPPDPSDFHKDHYENLYEKNDQKLLISFNPHTRKINFFFIVSSIEYDNIKDILKIGNLDSTETKDYWVEKRSLFFSKAFKSVTVHLYKN